MVDHEDINIFPWNFQDFLISYISTTTQNLEGIVEVCKNHDFTSAPPIIIDVIDENDNHTDDTLSWELDAGWSSGKRRPLTAAQIETDDTTTSDGNIMIIGITI